MYERKFFSKILIASLVLAGTFAFPMKASAAPTSLTVCAVGCDHTTIQAAVNASTAEAGSVVTVQGGGANPYDPTGETFPLVINKDNLTVTCTGNPTIGYSGASRTVDMGAATTIQDCTLKSVLVRDGGNAGMTITGNTFDTTEMSDIYVSGANATITNNTGVNGMYIDGSNANIDGNTIRMIFDENIVGWGHKGINIKSAADGATINNNTITSELSGTASSLIDVDGADNTQITNNTLSYPTDPNDDGNTYSSLNVWRSSNVVITGNYISNASNMSSTDINPIIIVSQDTAVDNIDLFNNTIKINSTGGDTRGIEITDNDAAGPAITDVDIKYNIIFANSDYTGTVAGISIRQVNSATAIEVYEDYNNTYNITATNITNPPTNLTFTQGGNTTAINPGMMSEDLVSQADDLHPFPASCMYDVDGTTDMGAYSGTRTRTTIYVDDTGIINYSTVDLNSIQKAVDATCGATSTISVDAGTYSEQVDIIGKDGITVTGAGSGTTTIDSSGINTDPALWLYNADNSTISGFTIMADATDAAALMLSNGSEGNTFTDLILNGITPAATSYNKTYHPYSYNGTNYTTAVYMAYQKTGVVGDFFEINENDENITTIIDATPQTWNFGLVNNGSDYYSMLWDDTEYPSTTEATQELTALGGTWTIDCWVDDAFVYSNGSYHYTAPTGGTSECSGSAPTVITSGYQTNPSTPEIFKNKSGSLYVINSDNNNFSSTTVQNAANGASFGGTAADNTIGSSMTFTSNTTDVYTSSSENNSITDCSALTYSIKGSGGLTGCQTAPTGSITSASQDTGENTISIVFTASDADKSTLQAKIEYESDSDGQCDGPWSKANISTTISASNGTPSVDNSSGYQITGITTASGANTISTKWNANENIGDEDGTHCVRLTVNDGTDDQAAPSTKTVEYAYIAPTPPAETGGTSIGAFLSGLRSAAKKEEAVEDSEKTTEEESDEATKEAVEEESEKTTEEESKETVEEPTEEPAPSPATEELPNDTVIKAANKYVVEPTYRYFAQPQEEPVTEYEYIESQKVQKAIEEYNAQEGIREEMAKEPINEIIAQGTPLITKEIEKGIEEKKTFTAYTSEGEAVELTNKKEVREFIKNETEKVGVANLDINNDHVADMVNLKFKVPLTDANPDNDILPTATEFFCGTDPNTADVNDWNKPIIKSVDRMIVGTNPEIHVCSMPGDTVKVVLIEKSQSEESVLGASVLNADKTKPKEILAGTAKIDDGYKGSVKVREALPDGEYYVFAVGDKGTGIAELTIDSEQALEDLTIEIAKEKLEFGTIVDKIVEIVAKANKFDKDKFISELAGKEKESIVLTAPKETIVYITIESRVFSSVVIADANGITKIQQSLLKELPVGTHEITAYATDPDTRRLSNLISFLYKK